MKEVTMRRPIQVTQSSMPDFEEYIEEIEKMAEIVNNDEGPTEQAIPFEFKMSTGRFLLMLRLRLRLRLWPRLGHRLRLRLRLIKPKADT